MYPKLSDRLAQRQALKLGKRQFYRPAQLMTHAFIKNSSLKHIHKVVISFPLQVESRFNYLFLKTDCNWESNFNKGMLRCIEKTQFC